MRAREKKKEILVKEHYDIKKKGMGKAKW